MVIKMIELNHKARSLSLPGFEFVSLLYLKQLDLRSFLR